MSASEAALWFWNERLFKGKPGRCGGGGVKGGEESTVHLTKHEGSCTSSERPGGGSRALLWELLASVTPGAVC